MPVMMTETTTIDEKIASLTKVIEDMANHVQRQEETLSHMAAKMHDHEQRAQAVQAGLRTLPPKEAPSTSKESPATRLTPSHQASTHVEETTNKCGEGPMCLS
ncbi:hypothetical protein LIER_14466 [Lithospermum erythrorhizon]|uniref:Uncharacterized protein n=1 Tax=Lithospermum erythrorhizon TaxID=34254 RepID=A0AAV3Q178_LITER